jgi:hypothetical protein
MKACCYSFHLSQTRCQDTILVEDPAQSKWRLMTCKDDDQDVQLVLYFSAHNLARMYIIQNGARCTSQHNDNYGYHIISYHNGLWITDIVIIIPPQMYLVPVTTGVTSVWVNTTNAVFLRSSASGCTSEPRGIPTKQRHRYPSGRASAPSVSRSAHPYPSSSIRVWGQRGDRGSGNPSPTYTQGVLTSTLVLRSPVIVITTLSIA